MRHVFVVLAVISAALAVAATAAADGKGPQVGQFGPAVCSGGSTFDVLTSPADAAHTGQVTGSNVNIVSLQITVTDSTTGEVLFQSPPTAGRNPQAQTCTIDGGGVTLTLWAIVTPR
jgi:hypothetical protein